MKAATCVMAGLLILSSAALAQQKAAGASDEAALRALEDKWAAALLKADTNSLASILADTWVVTYIDGKVDNKAGELAALKAGTLKISSYKNDDVRVFLYGDAAVVTGRASMKGVEHGKARYGDALDGHVCQAERAMESCRHPRHAHQVSLTSKDSSSGSSSRPR